jgi:hypothetical protein
MFKKPFAIAAGIQESIGEDWQLGEISILVNRASNLHYTYRWGEDGLAGVSDDEQCLCLALALWNGKDPILKEHLFGLTNGRGNHGEDVKELYYYLDATPTHSYLAN